MECPECAAVLDEETAFADTLAALPDEAPMNDVWALVRARIRPRRAWRPTSLTARRVAMCAAAAAIAVGVLQGIHPAARQTEQTRSAPASPSAVTVKWSDDPLGQHTDAVMRVIEDM